MKQQLLPSPVKGPFARSKKTAFGLFRVNALFNIFDTKLIICPMNKIINRLMIYFSLICSTGFTANCWCQQESQADHDQRMEWWREARFGLFIHWGLYAIPAGEWKGETNHGEWIRTTAQIPLDEYDQFVHAFNPEKFDAGAWVKMAKDAGMKYIVITSKHHDGFGLFNSQYTDFDIMSTPFQRDILKELSEACKKEGIKMCWYHSIMDWHHPDYLPRRDWETERTTAGADFNRYIEYLKNQLRELLTNYGEIGVLWFDGEWESTWNEKYGKEIYDYVRSLQPSIIVNNRVGAAREGMEGSTKEGGFGGDFGTPEQQIPATGLPGVDWETCMTMNDHWGYNKNNHNWKSTRSIVQMLADIASKGGNYLLNVGPTAEGLFPQESIDRLQEIGQWMKINGEAIYGTQASPFSKLSWGRCTQKKIASGTRLYLHVFDKPADGRLIIPGLFNNPGKVFLLADPEKNPLPTSRSDDAVIVTLPQEAKDPYDLVVVMDLEGLPDVNQPPVIKAFSPVFINNTPVTISSNRENIDIHYTTDETTPGIHSPLYSGPFTIDRTTTVSARSFRDGKPVSPVIQLIIRKTNPLPAKQVDKVRSGLHYRYYEGNWDSIPDFSILTPVAVGIAGNLTIDFKKQPDYFGVEYSGFLSVPADDVYTLYLSSDDGSRLYIGEKLLIDNNYQHGIVEKSGIIALSAGLHPVRITFFEKTGGDHISLAISSPGMNKTPVSDSMVFIEEE
jgi:alpha-L-fucosidase